MYWSEITRRLICLALVVGSASAALADAGDDQYTLAARHYSRTRWKLAAEEFEAFLAEFPQHQKADQAVFFLGESLVQLKRYGDARERFLTFVARAPQHPYAPQALLRTGETAFLDGDHETAKRELENFGTRHPEDRLNAYGLAYRGEIALQQRDFETAKSVYREAIQTFPTGPLTSENRFGLARALEQTDEVDEALRFYQFLAENTPGRLRDDANLRAGMLLYKQKRYAEASEVLAIFDGELAESRLRSKAHYWLGMAALDGGNPRRAIEIFATGKRDRDVSMRPAFEFGFGKAERRRDDVDKAIEHFQEVYRNWPDSQWADDALHALIEMAYERKDRAALEEHTETFRSQHADSPLAAQVWQLAGRDSLRQAQFERAVELFEQRSKATDETPFARMNRYYLGVAYLGAERHADALDVLERVRPQEDEQELRDSLAVARASALIAIARYPDALGPLHAYLQSQPAGADAADCRAKLAICYAEVKDWEAVRLAFEDVRKDSQAESFLPTVVYLADRAEKDDEKLFARQLYKLLTADEIPHEYAVTGLSRLGNLQRESGEAAESAKTFERLLEKAEDSDEAPQAALWRARLLEETERYNAASAAYRLVFDKYPKSGQAAIAKFDAAKLHDRLGQDREARDLLRELLDDRPEFEQADAVLYQLAWVLIDLGEDEQANAVFEQLVGDRPQGAYWADATYRLAERSLASDDRERAGRFINKLLDADVEPRLLGHALYLQGQLAGREQRWKEVVRPMQKLVDEELVETLRLPALYWIAEAKFRQADFEDAGARFAKLADETTDLEAAWIPMVHLRQAQVLAHQEQWADALAAAEKIAGEFAEFRQQFEVDYLIGRCLSTQARFAEAREAFARVVRSPNGGRTETAAMAQWMIGESFFHQKQYHDAIRAYHRVEGLYAYPQWQAAALLQAGKSHELLGEWKEAVKLYAQLLQEHAETKYAEEAARRLGVAQQQTTAQTTN
jgi:TolA-binding protein